MISSMINPSIVDLLEKVENKYTLVTIASKRARQLINGEKPIIPTIVVKPVTIACNEINSGLLTYETVIEGIK